MRLAPTLSVLALARELAASAEGLTFDEMASIVNASRRSVERKRDAVEAAFGARPDRGRARGPVPARQFRRRATSFGLRAALFPAKLYC
jgi:hypothetical protein